ncbi:hypothetical protein [Streptomyces calidiresistens]|uniref:Uncharacterized protein n=1 Tax=Streptomyces calidiresistens TaxID=1485586 RepID=A0A7W3T604_9ACTN|nr:hypothetical protein [Streptomyces calidiresistens]MBB0231281.1 hypothetical protein [Streptomyces calidiresistens]
MPDQHTTTPADDAPEHRGDDDQEQGEQRWKVVFHTDTGPQTLDVTTHPSDEQNLEEWLATKLEQRMEPVALDEQHTVLLPTAPRFAAFETGDGGMMLLPTGRITRVDVTPLP